MSRISLLAVVLAVLLGGTVASAQTARYWGMGNTGVAAANDAAATGFNPANLAFLDVTPPAGLYSQYDPITQPWDWQAAGTVEASGDWDYKAVHFAGRNNQDDWGIGACWQEAGPGDSWGLGFGAQAGARWGWGLSVEDIDTMGASGDTYFNGGLLYLAPQPDDDPVKLGLYLRDLTDETGSGPLVNLGIAIPLMARLGENMILSADWLDATNEVEAQGNVGVEYTAADTWTLRAGLVDGEQVTAGIGYDGGAWKLDAAWVESASAAADDEVVATVSHSFK